MAKVATILEIFDCRNLNTLNWSFLQGIFSPHTSNLSPCQNLSFAHSLPIGDFSMHTLASRDQCSGLRRIWRCVLCLQHMWQRWNKHKTLHNPEMWEICLTQKLRKYWLALTTNIALNLFALGTSMWTGQFILQLNGAPCIVQKVNKNIVYFVHTNHYTLHCYTLPLTHLYKYEHFLSLIPKA